MRLIYYKCLVLPLTQLQILLPLAIKEVGMVTGGSCQKCTRPAFVAQKRKKYISRAAKNGINIKGRSTIQTQCVFAEQDW